MQFMAFRIAAASACLLFAAAIEAEDSAIRQSATDNPPAAVPDEVIEVLEINCFGCHADGAAEGNFQIDELLRQTGHTDRPNGDVRDAWHRVLKNVRSQIMPPSDAGMMEPEELESLSVWIGHSALGVDPERPDPGTVTMRRLNRTEYRNTVRDLLGVDFEAEVEFPPDDSGHGFDNLGDVLSLSPLLMEKYLVAAETMIDQAVPMVSWVPDTQRISVNKMQSSSEQLFTGRVPFRRAATVAAEFEIENAGTYRVVPRLRRDRGFDFSPLRARLTVRLDEETIQSGDLAWSSGSEINISDQRPLSAGPHTVTFQLEPLPPEPTEKAEANSESPERPDDSLAVEWDDLEIVGPLETDQWVRPENWERFFAVGSETDPVDRASSVIQAFATRAFRRPVEPTFVQRLVDWIEPQLRDENITFERAVAPTFAVILSSPRFVFRQEPVPSDVSPGEAFLIDSYSLANRLSYFLWSSMPDEELFELASTERLRDELPEQIDRMLADPKSEAFVSNFVGQWLRTRDVENTPVDALAAAGLRGKYDELRDQVRELFRERRKIAEDAEQQAESEGVDDVEAAVEKATKSIRSRIGPLLDELRSMRKVRDSVDAKLRKDIRRQTERLFEYILENDRSVLELIDNDYEFLNERLAEFLGIDVSGPAELHASELRRFDLSEDSRRGGVLRQPSFLIVTSNPTRTSPVKRGLFILDNILGTPAPPAPAAVPELEESAEELPGDEPTLRELLQRHREDPLCASCHRRFDPMGLALENYNALGRWRVEQGGKPIEPAGELISGETFQDADELMRVLTGPRRFDFYRCLSEKLLIYAVGRGLDYRDEPTLESLVRTMEQDGRTPTLRHLIHQIIHSPPFQMSTAAANRSAESSETSKFSPAASPATTLTP